jgi:uncharacterized membrane protein
LHSRRRGRWSARCRCRSFDAIIRVLAFLLGKVFIIGAFFSIVLGGIVASILFWLIIVLAVWLTIMVWFRPNYRLPFVGQWIENLFARWR